MITRTPHPNSDLATAHPKVPVMELKIKIEIEMEKILGHENVSIELNTSDAIELGMRINNLIFEYKRSEFFVFY